MAGIQNAQRELTRFLAAHSPPERGCWQVRSLLECIHQHLFECRVSVGAIKRFAALRDHNVSCLFKCEMGVSIKDYMDALRLEAATELLEATSLSVATVAQAVGYQHLQTFYRAVHRRFGCTPLAIRKRSLRTALAQPPEPANGRAGSTPPRADVGEGVRGKERDILAAAMARILPATDAADGGVHPGAAEAGAIEYFGWLSRQNAFRPYAQTLRDGLALLDSLAVALYGRGYVECEASSQDVVLRQVQEIEHPGAQRFFSLLMRATLSGFLCSPMYGGNRDGVGWRLIDHTPDPISVPGILRG